MKTRVTRLLAGIVLLAASLLAVPAFAAGHLHSGVIGEVVLSHGAVEYEGADCYDPYQAGMTVTTQSGRFVTRVISDENGRFRVFLKPGDYVLMGDTGDSEFYPDTKPVDVHVDRKRFTRVRIVYDSGIR